MDRPRKYPVIEFKSFQEWRPMTDFLLKMTLATFPQVVNMTCLSTFMIKQ